MELFKRLNDEGTTIVQVTHSEVNAAYGNRIVNLFDGWMKDDLKVRSPAGKRVVTEGRV